MPEQKSRSYMVYEYVTPAEDWEVTPPRETYPSHAEMAWYPHSGRIYVRWKETLSNPIRDVEGAPEGSTMQAHYGITELHSTTTFYVRDIAEDTLPIPYKYTPCTLTWGTDGGPTKDDPLGCTPEYDTITIKRFVWSRP